MPTDGAIPLDTGSRRSIITVIVCWMPLLTLGCSDGSELAASCDLRNVTWTTEEVAKLDEECRTLDEADCLRRCGCYPNHGPLLNVAPAYHGYLGCDNIVNKICQPVRPVCTKSARSGACTMTNNTCGPDGWTPAPCPGESDFDLVCPTVSRDPADRSWRP